MKKFDPKRLPYIAAFVQSIQFGHAGFIYFGWVGLGVVGLLGIPVSLSMATASSRINDIAKKRKLSAWIFFVLLSVISPLFIGIAVYQEIHVENIYARFIASAVWGLAADGSVALAGFITGKSLVADEKQTATRQVQPATRQKQIKSRMSEPATCPYCKREGTLGAINSHKGRCKKNPAYQFAGMANQN